ncbi:MAG: hypothetical protein FK733_16290 [Asgard group archaeon]|nr:hypothetical protein [Asgard group archaeon]
MGNTKEEIIDKGLTMTISVEKFENSNIKKRSRSRTNLVIGESFLLVRFLISLMISVVIFILNSYVEFSYVPIFAIIGVQTVFLII